MEHELDISRLLLLRSLTTKLGEHFAQRVRDYLTHLAPLLQPHTLFGDLVRFGKSSVNGQDAAFQELSRLFQPLARASALNLQSELKAPLDIFGTAAEI